MATKNEESPRLPQAEIADILDRLVARSLVQVDLATGRYTLLQSIASYGGEHMEQGERDESFGRFEDYFLTLAGVDVISEASAGASEFERIDDDIENFRTILKTCASDRDRHERGLHLALRLCNYWDKEGLHKEASWWLDQFALDAVPKTVACEACYWSGICARRSGKVEEATQLLNAAAALAKEVGNRRIEAESFSHLAGCKLTSSAVEDAIQLDNKAIVAARASQDILVIANTLNGSAKTLRFAGRHFPARTLLEESLALAEEAGDNLLLARVMGNLSQVCAALGDFGAALSYGVGAYDLASDRFPFVEVAVLIQVAAVLIYLGNIELGTKLLASADKVREERDYIFDPVDIKAKERAMAFAEENLGSEIFNQLRQQGRNLVSGDVEQIIETLKAASD